MAKLKTKKGGEWVPPRVVLYGDEKIGKTSTAAQAPRPLYIGTDDGCRRLGVDYLDPPDTWQEYVEQLHEVVAHAKGDGFESVVTDTLNGVVDLCAKYVCDTQFGGKWNDPKYGFLAWGGKAGWRAVSEQIRKVLPLYDKLTDAGLWVIILAHSQTEKQSSPTDGDYDRYAPAMHSLVWARVGQWADCILRVDFEKSFTEKDGKRRVITDGTRVLRCTSGVAEIAGCRAGYELPDEMPLSWESIAVHLGNVNFADELGELIADLSATDGVKALKWLGVDLEHLADAPAHKAKDLIGRLRVRASE